MILLKAKGEARNLSETLVAKVIRKDKSGKLFCFAPSSNSEVILSTSICENYEETLIGIYKIPILPDLEELDVVLITPKGNINTLYRYKSNHNSLFITDRCNSNCLMCSQPPKDIDDLDYYFNINSQLIKLISPSTKMLGITGGEPLILGKRFIILLNLISTFLPNTEIHVLTNGRQFAWKNVPFAISKVKNKKIVFGIPLYSSFFKEHDYIVQARNAFDQTVLGLHNMARYNLRLEIRVVLHKQTFSDLPKLAQYIFKNLPFVEHIAFMGLEYTGYTPYNKDLLWIEPNEYMKELEESVLFLDQMGLTVSIYNLQLCLLKPSLWRFAVNSISDWKMEYLEECNNCKLLEDCGGLFATSKKHSNQIKAIN